MFSVDNVVWGLSIFFNLFILFRILCIFFFSIEILIVICDLKYWKKNILIGVS